MSYSIKRALEKYSNVAHDIFHIGYHMLNRLQTDDVAPTTGHRLGPDQYISLPISLTNIGLLTICWYLYICFQICADIEKVCQGRKKRLV